jgi:N-methylhydantoinase A/oxoprolinase/acetone carboxylase beta subunit
MALQINIDNGGTLTDICIMMDDTVKKTKVLTTPYDLSKCFFEGLQKASGVIYGEQNVARLLEEVDLIRYSTTQGTNAICERRAAPGSDHRRQGPRSAGASGRTRS